jgi:hypothetical protein
MWIDTTPVNQDTWNWITGQENKLELHCHCGEQATWILLYGCHTYKHTWEDHLCLNCLHKKTAWTNPKWKIENHPYNATQPWTCINAVIHDPNTGEPIQQVHCQVTRWYAKELTPDMITRIKQQTLEEIRQQNRESQGARTPDYDT